MKEIRIDVIFAFLSQHPDDSAGRDDAGRAFAEWLEHCPTPEAYGLKFKAMVVEPQQGAPS